MMTYEAFQEKIRDEILEYLPEAYRNSSVLVNEIEKNRETVHGLVITSPYGVNACPNIYLEAFYDALKKGAAIEVILREIAEIRLKYELETSVDIGEIENFSAAETRILPRLVGTEQNEKLLQKMPWVRFHDFAVIFVIDLTEKNPSFASAPITKELMESWHVTLDQLYLCAVRNMKGRNDYRFSTMAEILSRQGINVPEDEMEFPLFVLTNESGSYGASLLLYTELLEKIREKIGAFYILPSSVHELILVPGEEEIQAEALGNIVKEVNRSEVQTEDVLSDSVYYYDGEIRTC